MNASTNSICNQSVLSNVFADNSTSPNAFIQFVIDENQNKSDPYKINEHWRPQVATCPYCLFSYKVYERYETVVEDTAYILLKSNHSDLLKKGYLNSSPHHQKKQKKSRAKEDFWAKVDPILIHELYKVFDMDFIMFQYN